MNNKSFSIFTSLVVCLVVGNPSCSGEEQPARIFECVYTAVPVIVDGNLSEDAWRNASEIARFTRPGPGGVLPNSVTKVRTCWDKDYFYFAAEMEDRDIVARLTQHDDLLWTEDVFEVFMRPSKQHNGYYEFQVNPLETTLDIYWPQMPMGKDARNQMFRDQLKSNEFDFDVRVKQLQEQNYWIVEGRIGWKQMHMTGGRPAVEEAWDVAFCRYDYGLDRKPETSSSASLSRIDFHAVEEYDRLVFKTPVRVSAKTHVDQSRVVGSPDPPLRYTVKKLIPRLPLSQAIFMTANPQTGELIFINQGESGGKSQLLLQHGATNELVTMVELDELAYSLCFHPKFADNGYIYVGTNQTTGVDSKSRVWRYQFNGARCDPDDRKLIIEWPSNGHNGAAVSFGLDGMLYVTAGDGTSDSDTNLAGQRLDHLLGKVLRLDVDHPDNGRGYGIPTDNPFMDREGVRKETFAYGLRNPWRMTTDPNTGNIWIGNNGQDQWEQIYLLERGANYGWSVYEGGHAFYLTRMLGPDPLTKPIFDHPHSEARSLTGGIVYHGSRYPDLNGSYLYGDHSTGKIWAAKHNGKRLLRHEEIADTQLAIVAFAVGPEGNILILDYKSDTEIFELIPNTRKVQVRDFPRKLSETGLFVDVRNHAMQEGVIPYDVNSPLWSDGVLKNRFIALTSDSSKITATHQGAWEFEEGTVLIKSFGLDLDDDSLARPQYIETRLLTKQDNEWVGYSYRWNQRQTDAYLVPAEGQDAVFKTHNEGPSQNLKWHFPSRSECMVCHSRAAKYVLGLQTAQLNREMNYEGHIENQLTYLERTGRLIINTAAHRNSSLRDALTLRGSSLDDVHSQNSINRSESGQRQSASDGHFAFGPASTIRLAGLDDESRSLEARARSYLYANCANCHIGAGGGNSQMHFEYFRPLEEMKIVNVAPLHGKLGNERGLLIRPGIPDDSVLLQRMLIRGNNQMPVIGSHLVDENAVKVIRDWIKQLGAAADCTAHD